MHFEVISRHFPKLERIWLSPMNCVHIEMFHELKGLLNDAGVETAEDDFQLPPAISNAWRGL